MSRMGATLSTLVILVLVSSVQGQQTGRDGKSEREDVEKLISSSDCGSCHSLDRKVVGPSYVEIAMRYSSQAGAAEQLIERIRQGGSGNWGTLSMPPHPDLKDAQLVEIVAWILSLNDGSPVPRQESKAKQFTYAVNGNKVTVDFPVFVEGDDKKVTKDVFHGYQLYNSYCFRCHGTDATESALAPDLRLFTAEATQREFLSVAMVGREDKGMPSWAGFLSEEDVQQIYKYVKGRSLGLVPAGRPPSDYD